MEISDIYRRIHYVITEKVRRNEMLLTREAVKDFASMTSAQLLIIIGDANESKANKKAAHKALFALSMAERDLDENLAK